MILGPLVVTSADGTAVPVSQPLLRRVLATLILSAGVRRPRPWLVQAVWGERPPADPGGALRTAVHGLRQCLGDSLAARLESPGRGRSYMFRAEHGEVDALQFDELAALGGAAWDAGEYGRAAELLGAAAGLWRVPALADVPDTPFLEDVRGVLLRRLAEVEDLRTDAILKLGGHREAIGHLRQILAGDPLREHAWAQLMLALYRDGRPDEALDAFAAAERLLQSQLGCEPGPYLTEIRNRVGGGAAGLTTGKARPR
jgi:DNA-binding SARP family transcriptional activator